MKYELVEITILSIKIKNVAVTFTVTVFILYHPIFRQPQGFVATLIINLNKAIIYQYSLILLTTLSLHSHQLTNYLNRFCESVPISDSRILIVNYKINTWNQGESLSKKRLY